MLVRLKGKCLSKIVEAEEGSFKFSLQLWWEVSLYVGNMQGARFSMQNTKPTVKEEKCGASRVLERVK